MKCLLIAFFFLLSSSFLIPFAYCDTCSGENDFPCDIYNEDECILMSCCFWKSTACLPRPCGTLETPSCLTCGCEGVTSTTSTSTTSTSTTTTITTTILEIHLYNFSDTNSNWAWNNTQPGDSSDPPLWGEVWGGNPLVSQAYTNLSSSDNVYAYTTRATANNDEPQQHYNFTILENQSSIVWFYVALEQKATSNGEVCTFLLANFTNKNWFKFGADSQAEATRVFNTTNKTEISKLINGKNITSVASQGVSMDSNEGCDIDFVEIRVGYSTTTTTSTSTTSTSTTSTTTTTTPCEVMIPSIPYNMSLNNTYYCLNQSVSSTARGIQIGNSSISNSTLDCQGNELNATTEATYFNANSNNNTVKNCYIRGGYYCTYFVNNNYNNTFINNTCDNQTYQVVFLGNTKRTLITNNTFQNADKIFLMATDNDYCNISFNTFINGWGIKVLGGDNNNNIFHNNTFENMSNYGIALGILNQYNNKIYWNTFKNTSYGIRIYESFDKENNQIYQNTVYNCSVGIEAQATSVKTNFTDNSVFYNTIDLRLNTPTNNFFDRLNFTEARRIDITSTAYFNYLQNGIWLNTSMSSSINFTRKIILWRQDLIKWNDTATTTAQGEYIISGLAINTFFEVFNNSIEFLEIKTDNKGSLNFSIPLVTSGNEIMVKKKDFKFKFADDKRILCYANMGLSNNFTDNGNDLVKIYLCGLDDYTECYLSLKNLNKIMRLEVCMAKNQESWKF